MTKARSPRLVGIVARCLAVALVLWLLATSGLVLALRWLPPPVTAFMFEQPGSIRDLKYAWRDRPQIAVSVARAVIAAEDQRFLAHHGFDFESMQRAVEDYRAGDELRGASTITQQVSKNLFLWSGRSFVRKGLEAYFTVLLEACWPKQRILEVYLNVVELGAGVFGVEAAAQRFYGIHARDLSAQQAALLAAVLPNPRRLRVDKPSDYVRERQSWIVGQMQLLEMRGHYRGLAW